MTSERRLMMGLDDIRALTFECNACAARLTLAPARARPDMLRQCPSCAADWLDLSQAPTGAGFANPFARFLALFSRVLEVVKDDEKQFHIGFRILLEFNEPK